MIVKGALIWLVLIAQVAVPNQPQVSFQNDYGEQVTLWFRPRTTMVWWQPPTIVPNKESKSFRVVSAVKWQIVLQDQSKRDKDLGWYDLAEIANRLRNTPVVLSAIYEQQTTIKKVTKEVYEERELCYTICTPVWEYRSRLEPISDPYTGQISYYVERWYRVCKMVPEQRTRIVRIRRQIQVDEPVQEMIKRPVLKVMVSGHLVPLEGALQPQ